MKKICIIFIMLGVIFISNDMHAQQQYTKSTWLWQTDTITDERTVKFLLDKKVTTVYLQIDPTLSNDCYATFINKMEEANIEVQALDGAPDWDTTNFDTLWAWLSQYHQAYPASKFTAVHLDVEHYLSTRWTEDQNKAVYQYQALLQYAQQQTRESGMKFEVDIPFWYDEILYANTVGNGNLAEWIIANVDGVSIMAYRNTVPALKNITENEMNYAKLYQTPIVIGVETMHFPNEPQLSFASKGEKSMNRMLNQVIRHYAKNRYFDGVAIHHVHSWEKLKK